MAQEETIRPLEAGEWTLLRELRLRALRDSPDSFGPTAAEVGREDDDYWREGARRMAGRDSELLVAEVGGSPVGLVFAGADRERVGHVGAMWVAPAARGGGLGRRMVCAALDALESRGCARVELWVTEGNAPAVSLYESLGFRFTGRKRPLREGSALQNLEMARVRAGSA